jgi:cytochrome c biogenesis protein CcmG/thiol:disulfide interchange protein DsbE
MNPLLRVAGALGIAVMLCGTVNSKNVGDTAPDFSRTDFAGRPVHLADYRGKLVLLNFWASWCGPCLQEMPRFFGWQKDYGARGLQIIGVSMDDDGAAAERLLARRPAPYPMLLGDAKLGETFGGVRGLPLTFLIDPRGRIAGRYEGDADLAKMEAQIKAMLPRR